MMRHARAAPRARGVSRRDVENTERTRVRARTAPKAVRRRPRTTRNRPSQQHPQIFVEQSSQRVVVVREMQMCHRTSLCSC